MDVALLIMELTYAVICGISVTHAAVPTGKHEHPRWRVKIPMEDLPGTESPWPSPEEPQPHIASRTHPRSRGSVKAHKCKGGESSFGWCDEGVSDAEATKTASSSDFSVATDKNGTGMGPWQKFKNLIWLPLALGLIVTIIGISVGIHRRRKRAELRQEEAVRANLMQHQRLIPTNSCGDKSGVTPSGAQSPAPIPNHFGLLVYSMPAFQQPYPPATPAGSMGHKELAKLPLPYEDEYHTCIDNADITHLTRQDFVTQCPLRSSERESPV